MLVVFELRLPRAREGRRSMVNGLTRGEIFDRCRINYRGLFEWWLGTDDMAIEMELLRLSRG